MASMGSEKSNEYEVAYEYVEEEVEEPKKQEPTSRLERTEERTRQVGDIVEEDLM